MPRTIYPKNYITEVLIGEIGDVVSHHAYLSFSLICSGIEFLGICLDDSSGWLDEGKSKRHFINATQQLFPEHYHHLALPLYKSLRCGLIHGQLPGGYSLTELRHDSSSSLKYDEHLVNNDKLIVVEYFYNDFVTACQEIISKQFSVSSKMSKPFLKIS